MEKTKQTVPSVVPRHVAIIMDGNNRWAKKRFLPGVAGHKAGVDAVRAVALGAEAVLAGKAFLWSLGALGARGPAHMIDLFIEEIRATLGQLGCTTVADLRTLPVRHPRAYRAADFAARTTPP